MEVILILIPIALIFVGIALWLFFWAVDNGQFDDLDSPAHRILFDDDRPHRPTEPSQEESAAGSAQDTDHHA